MPEEMQRAKRPVNAALAGPYGHPIHPILVTIPIGAWLAALVFDIGSHIVDDPGYLARGAAWLIAIGVLGALAAALFGLIDLLRIPKGTAAFRTGVLHMVLNLLVVLAFALNWWWRIAGDLDVAVSAGRLALTAVTLAVLLVSGFLGGKLAYRYGVRVADETTQAQGFLR